VKRIARRYYAERIVSEEMLPEQVKTSEWMTWLGEQDWFVRDTAKLPENFPLVIKHLLTPQAYRQKVLLDLIAPDGDIGSGYRHLAELVLRGLNGRLTEDSLQSVRSSPQMPKNRFFSILVF
jgi:hypothetical protein